MNFQTELIAELRRNRFVRVDGVLCQVKAAEYDIASILQHPARYYTLITHGGIMLYSGKNMALVEAEEDCAAHIMALLNTPN